MRKRTQMSLLVMTGLLSTGLGGCGTPKTQTAPETGNSESQSVSSSSIVKESHSVVDSSEDIITEDNYTEEDIKDAVSGIHDLYILQSADSPNLLHGICYDKDIVNSISASGSGIDLEKVGEYEVKYEVEINAEKLAEYLSSKENPKATPGGAKYTTNTNPVITITQKVSVVSETEAEKLADKDTVVIGSKDEICKKSDGTEVEEKTEIPESCKKKGTTSVSADSGKEFSNEPATFDKKQESNTSEKKEDTKKTTPTPTDKSKEEVKNDTESQKNTSTSTKTTPTPTKSVPKSSSTSTPAPTKKPSTPAATAAPTKAQTATPAPTKVPHEHNWVEQYMIVNIPAKTHTVHHDAVYQTVHHDAITHEEPVYEYHQVCNVCGEDFGYGPDAIEAVGDHSAVTDHSYSSQKVCVGSTTVTDQEAYDEQRLVSEAYDETVVDEQARTEQRLTGYKCSGCGATKN